MSTIRSAAKGFTQVPGSDFYETYSPVFPYISLRTIFAVATDRGPVGFEELIYSAKT